MISFSPLTPADAPLLAQIGGTSLLESHGHSQPIEIMQAYVNRSFNEKACRAELENEQNIFSAVYYNNQPAGYYKIIYKFPHPAVSLKGVTKLERLYLLKEFYDLKLGHHLLEQAIKQSKAAGDKGMWLEVWTGNDRAIRFYQKKGFEMVGETEFRLTATHTNPAWVMLLQYE
ncbi:GNAT family N-acetyltransferase [Aridibaculum aurantiacum]|uniref:GNAT family N-acetyltransferase n=1 Tax=Aridibaculum aurantiacum TaxID=2810307 RepID=UPI001A96C5DA|nr:GNAT family N-acetyltransferase [Aridibaculum aurantiacum]